MAFSPKTMAVVLLHLSALSVVVAADVVVGADTNHHRAQVSHMRRESGPRELHNLARSHHKHIHKHVHKTDEVLLEDSPDATVGPEGAAQREVDAKRAQEAQEERNAQPNAGAPTQPIADIAQAEGELQKIDRIVVSAEEKAGLPDSTKTTPEPVSEEPTEADQEGNALMIAAISLVVLIGVASAAWSIWMARKMNAKGAPAAPLLEGEEGEAAEAETTAEAEGEVAGS